MLIAAGALALPLAMASSAFGIIGHHDPAAKSHQDADVVNNQLAASNSGLNLAGTLVDQDNDTGQHGGTNTANSGNTSTTAAAAVSTGSASASNSAGATVSQGNSATVNTFLWGGGASSHQDAYVGNNQLALANSGLNLAGTAVNQSNDTWQGGGTNTAGSANAASGSTASVTTGAAAASNSSTTSVTQSNVSSVTQTLPPPGPPV